MQRLPVGAGGVAQSRIKHPASSDTVSPDDRMVAHTNVLPKHLGTVSPLVESGNNFHTFTSGTFFERVPFVDAAPLDRQASCCYVVRVFNMDDGSLKLRIEDVSLELSPD